MVEEAKKEDKNNAGNDLIWGKNSSVQGSGSVKVINNRIYFYDYISHKSILNLTEQIHTVTKKMQVLAVENDIEPPPIVLHISSYGGSVFAGFAGMGVVRSNPLPIHTIVDGAAASAATLLSVVGYKRYVRKSAYMLIHQLSSFVFGKFEEIKDEMQNLEKLMDTIKQTYVNHTKIPSDELENILKHDWWFAAEDCLKFGLVDGIIE